MRPVDWVSIHNLARKCEAMPDGTDFWTSHSTLKALKDKAIHYAKQVEHRVRLLEKNTRSGCGEQVMEVKGLIREWDASKSLQNQAFDGIIMDLDFDKDTVKAYRELGKYFVKDVTSRQGVSKVIEYAALELKYMLGCDIEWNPTANDAAPSPAPAPAHAAATPDAGPLSNNDKGPDKGAAINDNGPSARAGAMSDGANSDAYEEGMDRGGDRNIYFQYWDPKSPYDTDWTQFAYPVAQHFIPRFRESHAMALMFFFDDELAAKLPNLCGQIHAGWQAHFKRPMNLDDILAPPMTGENAYDDEEMTWLYQTARFYVAKMTDEQRADKGINPNTAKKVLMTHRVRPLHVLWSRQVQISPESIPDVRR